MHRLIPHVAIACLLAGPLALPAGATYGGKPLAADDPARKSVIKLVINSPGWKSYCSGVIYSENAIATAANCLFRTATDNIPVKAETISVEYYHHEAIRSVTRVRFSPLLDMALLTTNAAHPAGFIVPDMDTRTPKQIALDSVKASFSYFGHGPARRGDTGTLTRLNSTPVKLDVYQGMQLRMEHSNHPLTKGTCGGDSGAAVMIQAQDGQMRLLGIQQADGSADEFHISDNCARLSYFTPIGRLKDWEPDLLDAAKLTATPSAPARGQ